MLKKKLGKSEILVSAIGMGCWPIGGEMSSENGKILKWEGIEDNESIRALHVAFDSGINLFDTADVYGDGHSEELIGKAFKGRRDKVVIATKFGHKMVEGKTFSPTYEWMKKALEGSLRRLNTDYIDIYQFHIWEFSPEKAYEIIDILERFVSEGKIRGYGWSTDVLRSVEIFSQGNNNFSTQVLFNVFEGALKIIEFAEKKNIVVFCRSCLAMGLLSGKYSYKTVISEKDFRGNDIEWIWWFKNGKPSPEYLKRLERVREILTKDGRTLVQGALSFVLSISPVTIPIPGIKNSSQAIENSKVMELKLLSKEEIKEIQELVEFKDITS